MAKHIEQSERCANCGATGDLVSFSTPGREPTKPLCMRCFRLRCREMKKQLRTGQFDRRAADG